MVLVALSLGYFMVVLDATAVNVALPRLADDLGGGVSGLQWVVDGYTLALAAFLLVGGSIADRFGSRRMLLGGLGLFAAASGACAAAPSVPLLVVARLVQGLGGAAVVPASLALVRAAFDDARARARALGTWGAVAGVAAASGPLIGGGLTGGLGWRAVFLVNVPVGAAAIVLARRALPAPAPRPAPVDPPGQLAATAGLALLVGGLIEGGDRGWASPLAGALLAGAAAALALFVALERRVARPLLPPALFRRPGFATGNAVGLLINLGFYGELFVLSLFFQRERGDSPLGTGVALLPQLAMAVIGSAVSGVAIGRFGVRRTMLTGLCLGAAGFGLLGAAGTDASYGLLVLPLVMSGLGMSTTMPAATAAVIEAAPAEAAGVASGAVNAFRQVGGAIGVALLGAFAGGGRYRLAALAAAAAFLAGALAVAAEARTPQTTREPGLDEAR